MNTLTTIDELGFAPALQQEMLEDTTSDHALLEATRTGDQDAFAELVSRYRNQITSYIYRMTNDYDGAVDLAQETFVRVYRAADRYQRSYAFSTYIYRIATNLAISELRKRKRRKLVSLTGFFMPSDGGEPKELNPPDGRPLQDSELVDTERRNAVQRAISTLAGEVSRAFDSARRGRTKLRRDREDPGDERRNGEVENQPGERVFCARRCGLICR